MSIDVERDCRVANSVVCHVRTERSQPDTGSTFRSIRKARQLERPARRAVLELAGRINSVDQFPFDGALALDPFGNGAEEIGEIAANLSFVHRARQAARSR